MQIEKKLKEKNFVAQKIELSSPVVTNENRPDTEVRHSNDLFSQDRSQHDRDTSIMGEIHKNHEDSYNQGNHNTGKINAPSNLP